MRTIALVGLLGLIACDSNPPQASAPESTVDETPAAAATPKPDGPSADAPKADPLVVKICKAFDKRHVKIEASTIENNQARQVWNVIAAVMQKTDKNYKVLMGIAPRGALEREIQAYVEADQDLDD